MLNLDTHILIYALLDKCSKKERDVLSHHPWSISAIVLWELAKLYQLRRIDLDIEDPEVYRVLSKIHVWPIDLMICKSLKKLDIKSDPADELIAATSIFHNIPLLTRDHVLLKSKVIPLVL